MLAQVATSINFFLWSRRRHFAITSRILDYLSFERKDLVAEMQYGWAFGHGGMFKVYRFNVRRLVDSLFSIWSWALTSMDPWSIVHSLYSTLKHHLPHLSIQFHTGHRGTAGCLLRLPCGIVVITRALHFSTSHIALYLHSWLLSLLPASMGVVVYEAGNWQAFRHRQGLIATMAYGAVFFVKKRPGHR